MPDGDVRHGEKSIGFVGRDERDIERRIDVGGWQQGRNGDWHPEAEFGWLGGERDEHGILSIRFDGLGAVSERDPQRGGLTLVGARATARLHLPSDDLFAFDITLTAPQLAAFTSRGSVRLPFDVTGGRGLKWLEQKPLTNAVEVEPGIMEGLDGGDTVRRPVWADGSYAVYHTSMRHDRNDGFGNWRRAGTGKICHVRRPHVTDLATGDVLWGQVEVVDGGLTLIFDAILFAARVGPFLFDPDVGYTSIGASNASMSNKRRAGGYFTMGEEGTLDSVSTYCASTGSWTNACWNDNASTNPTTVLGDGPGGTASAASWFAETVSGALGNGSKYWFGASGSGGTIKYDSTGGGAGARMYTEDITYSAGNAGDFGSPTGSNLIPSAFGSYTASGGGFAGRSRIIGGSIYG